MRVIAVLAALLVARSCAVRFCPVAQEQEAFGILEAEVYPVLRHHQLLDVLPASCVLHPTHDRYQSLRASGRDWRLSERLPVLAQLTLVRSQTRVAPMPVLQRC